MTGIDEQFILHARVVYGSGILSVAILIGLGAAFIWRAMREQMNENAAAAAVCLFTAALMGSMTFSPFIASWFAPDYYIQQYRGGVDCAKRLML